ncbi:MAG TPA: hypothetical protein VNT01_14885 [Symbiobacteriaceae bacterium]|nr:hypothetical protein [Symbiobacteriaceae bacterium]
MQYLAFEFESEKDMRETVKKLWDVHNVSGELSIRPIANSRWRVDVISEKELRETTLEKFAQWRVEAGD